MTDPHAWIANATDVRLAVVHRDHGRWLSLPNADLWDEEHAERTAEMTAIWREMQDRLVAEHREAGRGICQLRRVG